MTPGESDKFRKGYYDGNPKVQSYQLALHDIGHGGDYGCIMGFYYSFRINKNDTFFEGRQKSLSKRLRFIEKFTPFYNSLYERGIRLKGLEIRRDSLNVLFLISHEYSAKRNIVPKKSQSLANFLEGIELSYRSAFEEGFTDSDYSSFIFPILLDSKFFEENKGNEKYLREMSFDTFSRGLAAFKN